MRLAIFDFCDTLVNFQTANEFSKYVLKKQSKDKILKIDQFLEGFYFYRLFTKLGILNFSQKKLLLRGLKGLSKSQIESFGSEYVEEVIEKQLNEDVFKRFLRHIKGGDIVVINSGGYDAYLRYFSNKYDIKFSFATQFKYSNDIFTGEIEGNDCLGVEKVRRMKDSDVLDNKFSDIYVYSDSITDMPIFDLATQKIAIIKQETIPVWCKEHFEIIKV